MLLFLYYLLMFDKTNICFIISFLCNIRISTIVGIIIYMKEIIIKEFIKKLNKNAPFNSGSIKNKKYYNYFYPYKPILMISILSNINDINLLFNHQILIDKNSHITKSYYNLLTNNDVMFEFFNKEHLNKSNWCSLIYNEQVKKEVVNNIFENPAKHLETKDFLIVNKKNKTIEIKVDGTQAELEELRKFLLKESILCLEKCVPEYKGLSIDELNNYEGYIYNQILSGISYTNINKERTGRLYQHIFKKIIFERDKKCKICCLDLPELLQAAHIKPYSNCDNDIDRYSENNGILLCCNHHKLYDRGFFTFTNNWKVKISKELKQEDADLLIKTFEPCYLQIPNESSSFDLSKQYINYHQNNIFRKF